MDPNTSIRHLCLGENDRLSLNDGIESEGNWDTSEYLNLEYEKNEISNEFAVKLCLEYEVKNGEKVMKRELLAALRGELYFVKFIINLEQDDVEPEVVFGRSFLRITKGIVDFGNRILTIYADLITFNDDSDDELDELLASTYVSDLPPLDISVTTILAKFLLLDIPIDRDVPIVVGRSFLHTCRVIMNTIKGTTSTFDGIVHKKIYVTNVRNSHEESDSDDEKEYCLKMDGMGKPFYGPKHDQYLSCDDPIDPVLALREVLNPFKKICMWKKAIVFLGSLPVPLQHAEWIPNHSGNFAKKVIEMRNGTLRLELWILTKTSLSKDTKQRPLKGSYRSTTS
ncbi:hypothetical protein Tco_1383709 [Tanacetum coccineum]